MKNPPLNCWEFMNCGIDPSGNILDKSRICPATTITSFHGVNRGTNGGRFCWNVSGTYCNGYMQGLFATKIAGCIECDFLKKVQKEEGSDFRFLRS